MKKLFLALLLMEGACYAQGSLSFEYDEAGNQILREMTCVNCNTPSAGRHAMPGFADGQPDEIIDGQISYYPNPVLEQLHIEWTNDAKSSLKSINVYSISGQLVLSQMDVQDKDRTDLGFGDRAQGIYNIVLLYTNGEQKTIKVVKK